MTKKNPWTRVGMLALVPLTASCAVKQDSLCQYVAPQSEASITELARNFSSTINANNCDPFDLQFNRRSDGSFLAVVNMGELVGGMCQGITGSPVRITSSRGSVSSIEDLGNGTYVALITPDNKKSGEYLVHAYSNQGNTEFSVKRTALVFDQVDQRWGQPQAVEGMVNTLDWEDSAFITPDGEYLYTMYLSVSPSCVLEDGNRKDPACHQTQDQVTEENRPQFTSRFANGRVLEGGQINNQCTGVDPTFTLDFFKQYDVYVPPMMTYGFHRQPDGSFGNPFPVTVEGVSACTAPSGLEIQPLGNGQHIALMGFNDPSVWNTDQENDYPSLFTANIVPGQTTVLGTWVQDEKHLDTRNSDLKIMFGAPLKNRQDNPHGVVNPETNRIEAIFWDAEHVDEDIFYRLLQPGGNFPDGPWGPVKKTPVFSDPSQTEIQPFFDGKTLTVHKRYAIASHDFNGENFADIANPEAWGPERTELAVCSNHDGSETQVLHAVGDPTYADINGKKTMFFVYLVRRDNGLLDMNVGFVEEK